MTKIFDLRMASGAIEMFRQNKGADMTPEQAKAMTRMHTEIEMREVPS